MRFLGLLLVTAVAACPTICEGGTPTASPDVVQKEIRQALQQRLEALRRGDFGTYAAFIADNFITVDAGGKRMDKAAMIRDVRHAQGHAQSKETDIVVQSHGDAAVASYRQSIVEDVFGSTLHEECEITETYVSQSGRWLLAARQETAVPYSDHPPARVNSAVYDDYVGEYQITPTWIETISRDANRLYEKGTLDQDKVEDVPLSDTAFVQRGEAGVVTFERDATGKVVRLVLHLDNDDFVGVKIK